MGGLVGLFYSNSFLACRSVRELGSLILKSHFRYSVEFFPEVRKTKHFLSGLNNGCSWLFRIGNLDVTVLFAGDKNGVLLRTVLDPVTGDLSDTRTRYLGSRPVKLFRVRMQGQEAVSETSSQRGANPVPRHSLLVFFLGGRGGEGSSQPCRTLWVRVGSRMTS